MSTQDTDRPVDPSMKAALDAVEAVPEENLRAELRVAWMENLRLRRLLGAMVDVDGTQVGIVETYVCDPRANPGELRCAGVGVIVCCAGDEDALALHAGAAVVHLMGGDEVRTRIEARSALEVSEAVAARRREAGRRDLREKELAGLCAARAACEAIASEASRRAQTHRQGGAQACVDAIDTLLAARETT